VIVGTSIELPAREAVSAWPAYMLPAAPAPTVQNCAVSPPRSETNAHTKRARAQSWLRIRFWAAINSASGLGSKRTTSRTPGQSIARTAVYPLFAPTSKIDSERRAQATNQASS
jgi:hypothetical protein